LHINFVLGQYYVFLLFLLTLSFYCLNREHLRVGGFWLGVAFALKLYGGPFALYFTIKRQWKVVVGILTASLMLSTLAVILFGWSDVMYFVTHILPRAAEGETLDPYNPGNGTFSTLLRRLFVAEPELNPHPWLNAPWLFFFLRSWLTLAMLAAPFLLVGKAASQQVQFACFLIALVLVSPNTASYTFVLLLLPMALLLKDVSRWTYALLILLYAAVSMPMRPSFSWLFPKVWLLLALLLVSTFRYWESFRWKAATIVMGLLMMVSLAVAHGKLKSYSQEPGRHYEPLVSTSGTLYSSAPAVIRSGVVYEAIGRDRYILRWLHEGSIRDFAFEGEAFHPQAISPDGPIEFEIVAHGASKNLLLDVASGTTSPPRAIHAQQTKISPDRKWEAYTAAGFSTEQIWLRNRGTDVTKQVTGGACNNTLPTWEFDSKSIIFASDCGRGIGLSTLYRMPLSAVWAPR
jgi:hypothetical protein